jgi:putative ABC transport system permease protein
MNAFTDIWIAPAGAFNLLMAQPFPAQNLEALRRLPGVKAVRIYRGGLLDWGERRSWVIAPPRSAAPLIPPTQIVQGDLRLAEARLRRGGWAVVSLALAREHHLHIGGEFTLPSSYPARFRLAAISTNIGWAPGAVILNAKDYARAWGNDQPSAYNVLLARGVTSAQVRPEIVRTLGPGSGLAVQSAEQHAGKQRTLTREGLARLTEIARLILVVAVLAMAAAIGAMIWQRRPRLAKLKLEGFSRLELWSTVLLESALLLTVGCAAGALAGLLGQQLLDRALAEIVNYPVVSSLGLSVVVENMVLVVVAAVLVLAAPGYLAARVPASLALAD